MKYIHLHESLHVHVRFTLFDAFIVLCVSTLAIGLDDPKTCAQLPPSKRSNSPKSYNTTVPSTRTQQLEDIIKNGLSQLQFNTHNLNHVSEAIVILGNTGSGKTTLTQIIAGDLSKISAVLTHSRKLVIIDDGDKIGLPTTQSKTLVPEYVVNMDNVVLLDCPGFDDNRGPEMDIAAMFFLNHVTSRLARAKFLFTVTHSSVTIGNDRLDFDLLVSHVVRFLTNISDLDGSIALIVTKVSNYNQFGELIENEQILNGIVEFVMGYYNTLESKLSSGSKSEKEMEEIQKKMEFINTILKTDDNGNYTKIGFIREPPQCGPFSEIPYISEVREELTNLYSNQLAYALVNSSTFGFSLKANTLLKIEELFVPEIGSKMGNATETLVQRVKNKFIDEFNKNLEFEEKRLSSIVKFNNVFNQIVKLSLLNDTSVLNTIKKITVAFSASLDDRFIIPFLKEIDRQTKLLQFFNKVSPNLKFTINSFILPTFSKLITDFRKMKEADFVQIQNNFMPHLYTSIMEQLQVLNENLERVFFNHVYTVWPMWKGSALSEIFIHIQKFSTLLENHLESNITQKLLLSEQITGVYNILEFDLASKHVNLLQRRETDLNALKNITKFAITQPTMEASFELLNKLRKVVKWVIFLSKVDGIVEHYQSQDILNNVIQPMQISDDLELTMALGLNVSSTLEGIYQQDLNDRDKAQLHNILHTAASIKTTVACQAFGKDNYVKALVTGDYVKFSEFLTDHLPCEDNYKLLKEIEVLATETLFLDMDLIATGKDLSVTLIANRWEVVTRDNKTIKIMLNGAPGNVLDNPVAASGPRWSNGEFGLDGIPGNPGGNGGSFFGIFNELLNGNMLEVNVSGGVGGDAQHGGHGSSGSNGRDSEAADFPSSYALATDDNFEHFELLVTGVYNHRSSRRLGDKGWPGGNGGNGGVGGQPGYPGTIRIYNLSNAPIHEIRTEENFGEFGQDGEGGMGGEGGKYGNSYTCMWRSVTAALWYDSCKVEVNNTMAPNGQNGLKGVNTVGQQFPLEPKIPAVNWETMVHFSKLVIETSSEIGHEFITKIYNDANLTLILVKPISLANELLNLEVFWSEQLKKVNFTREFDFLWKRLEAYQLNYNSTLSTGEKKALKVLCAGVITRLTTIKAMHDNEMVINVGEFLSAVSNQLQSFKEGMERQIVVARKKVFHEKLEAKIVEASKMIKSVVFPSIAHVRKTFDRITFKTIQEMNNIQSYLKDDLHERKMEKRDFESVLIYQKILQGVSLVGTGLSVIGFNLGMKISQAAIRAKDYVVNRNPNVLTPRPLHYIPKALQETNYETDNQALQCLLERSEKIKSQMRLISKFSSKYSLDRFGGNIATKLQNLNSSLISSLNLLESKSDLSFKTFESCIKIDSCQHEFVNALQQQLAVLNQTANSSTVAHLEDIMTAIIAENINQNVAKAIKSAFKRTPSRKEQFKQMVLKSQQRIENVENRKQSIYQTFLPLFSGNVALVLRDGGQLEGLTRSQLLEWSWKMQEMLKDLKRLLRKFVKGLQVEEEVLQCVNKLIESVSLMVSMYETIDSYKESQDLVSYMADINAPNVPHSLIDDPQLREMTDKVSMQIMANLLTYDCEMATNAFKQWAFPFAKRYLAGTSTSCGGEVAGGNRTVQAIASELIEHITYLSSTLSKYKSKTVKHDNIWMKSYFTNSVSSRPFYTWRNSKWPQTIEQLLSGKAVQFRADVWAGDEGVGKIFRRGAVKFKTIELHLHHKDSSMRQELNKTLDHYHITMIHSGISLYRVLSKTYVMHSDPQTFTNSFERHGGVAVTSNVVGTKFAEDGDYLLSPYTLWTFQIFSPWNYGFENLSRFASGVDLELRGEGMFVDEGATDRKTLEELDLGSYYVEDNEIANEVF